jgi:ribonucleoside-diphosphate reductase alpha chain
MLIQLGLRYDSDDAIAFAEQLMREIKHTAYRASAELASEKGPFPAFDPETHLRQPFFSTFPDALTETIRQWGLRNVSLLTIPPVGSGSALAGCTNGLEPIFALSYVRRSESLSQEYFQVLHPLVAQYAQTHGLDLSGLPGADSAHEYLRAKLPPQFVTAHEIDPIKRVDMQAVLQRHIDQAISSTVNLPREATAQTVEQVYFHAWRSGLKGISVYREGSREGVLLTPEQARVQHKMVALADRVKALATAAAPDLPTDGSSDPAAEIEQVVAMLAERLKTAPVQMEVSGEPLMQRPDVLAGLTYRIRTRMGTMFVTINESAGEPVEVFCRLGKGGSHAEADSEMAGRLISAALRLRGPVPRLDRLEILADQLEGIGGGDPYGFGPSRVKSIADGIAKALRRYIDTRRGGVALEVPLDPEPPLSDLDEDGVAGELAPVAGGSNGNLCPRCQQFSLVTQQGCSKCGECGYKEC